MTPNDLVLTRLRAARKKLEDALFYAAYGGNQDAVSKIGEMNEILAKLIEGLEENENV